MNLTLPASAVHVVSAFQNPNPRGPGCQCSDATHLVAMRRADPDPEEPLRSRIRPVFLRVLSIVTTGRAISRRDPRPGRARLAGPQNNSNNSNSHNNSHNNHTNHNSNITQQRRQVRLPLLHADPDRRGRSVADVRAQALLRRVPGAGARSPRRATVYRRRKDLSKGGSKGRSLPPLPPPPTPTRPLRAGGLETPHPSPTIVRGHPHHITSHHATSHHITSHAPAAREGGIAVVRWPITTPPRAVPHRAPRLSRVAPNL